ncbi:helix-turn-helix domain-containing protein [Paenibacillus alginolyticus]|uniref:Helix-turn-helix domain-containing protein n=1 Tax=Paenibacillus alginolyticus TaxID=59839 RepID=A0ABT4GE90_9BACL|nr:helix-turn-helix domain-containing protein [Paenibacillus alginolyticus]MCY9694515.1 helix-turn-helix domain-containing protein [Paenibacillus alginolyticus]MEC0142676.1 helix-turn-helix domain-containing protein [Paenibacillus alginolyticus]
MYNLFIVEDEWLVLQGLKLTIPWEEMRCTLIGEARDGQAGLEGILANPPDILLTDIRMPAMDGIQLAEKVAELLPQVKVVFLTGFDDFIYAQKAVKLGAADFVLKPTNPDELIQVIGRITSKLDEERRLQSQQERLKLKYGWEKPLIEEKVLYDLMLDYAGTLEKEWFVEYGTGLEHTDGGVVIPPYRVVLLQMDGLKDMGTDSRQLRDQIKERIKELSKELSTLTLVRINETRYAFLANRQIERGDLADLFDSLMVLLSSFAQRCVLTVSHSFTTIDMIPAAYIQAMRAMYQTVFLGGEKMIWFEDIERLQETVSVNHTVLKELIELVKWGNPSSIEAQTGLWYSHLIHLHADGFTARRSFFEFIVTLNSLLLRDSELHNIVIDSGFLLTSAERVDDSLEQWLIRLNDTLFEWNRQCAELSDPQKKSGFEEIELFIREHYAEDISLQGIAERYHMSESYFSRLFKKQVGTSFLEYVTLIRVGQAKELLTNPRLRIYEVSVQVGYQDQRYFSQLFRKYTGETPTEFRKRLGIESLPL